MKERILHYTLQNFPIFLTNKIYRQPVNNSRMQLQEKHSDILLNYISCNLAKMLNEKNE